MTDQPKDLRQLRQVALKGFKEAASSSDLENWRVKYLGRRGELPSYLRTIKNLPLDKRRVVGQEGNKLRQELEQLYQQKLSTVGTGGAAESRPAGRVAASEPRLAGRASPGAGIPVPRSNGHLHPLTLTTRRIQSIMSDLGFLLAEGPLVEEARYNFDLLNIPLKHPARAATDTFYLTNGHVLRTHTSPVQLRAVLENDLTPPFRIFSPGRTFRAERTDASHETTFHQVEGLEIGERVTIANFKHTITAFFTQFYDSKVSTRLRPAFFPFVEPGFEVDVSCIFCKQQGCRVCEHTGWIEIFGAGMVHPNVLRNMNIDHHRFQGYAFGGGFDRLAMLRHGINDIRLFLSGDLKFLRQFS